MRRDDLQADAERASGAALKAANAAKDKVGRAQDEGRRRRQGRRRGRGCADDAAEVAADAAADGADGGKVDAS